MSKKHKHDLVYLDVIAGEQTAWFEEGVFMTGLNAGNRINHKVMCNSCEKRWSINNSSPKFIKSFYQKIDKAYDSQKL